MISKLNYLLLVSLILISCEEISNPDIENYDYSFIYNLTVNQENQKIYLFETLEADESIVRSIGLYGYRSFDYYSARGAEISVNSGIAEFNNFHFEIDTVYNDYYTNESTMQLKAETEYLIEIKIEDEIITGSTKTPGDFDIIFPRNQERINLNEYGDFIKIKWEESNNAFGYFVQIKSFYSDQQWHGTEHFTTLNYLQVESHFFYTSKTTIEIRAIDENIYNHILKENNQSGLEGAYGVFGSSVLKSVEVYSR